MIRYSQGNLLEDKADALVNTVNTVGVMGKGIALMFKETFWSNYREYQAACKRGEVVVGRMFVTEMLGRPRWIINFPTKEHWRNPSQLSWITAGLKDLRRVIESNGIRSIAVPALGCGNGGLRWRAVREEIERALGDLPDVEILVYEPAAFQNQPKDENVVRLTPARALILELIRRYSVVLGMGSSLLEIQKLAWFLEREIKTRNLPNLLSLGFKPHRFGPYSDRLRHLLAELDGSYLQSEVRIADAKPIDAINFVDERRSEVASFLEEAAQPYVEALEATAARLDGFESPMGVELLATVDWLLSEEHRRPEVEDLRAGLAVWPTPGAARRKLKLFDDRLLRIALDRLA